MRIVAIANQKGGCGKTTVAINLGACLAKEGQRTLLIDLDPQGHCALGLAVPEEQMEFTIADVLLDPEARSGIDLPRITWQISNNFDLAPAKNSLSTLESRLAGVPQREERLRGILERVSEKYDFVLIDSPPTVGFLTQTTLMAADEVVVPVDTGYFALHGLAKQLETIRELAQKLDRPLKLRILGNLYDVRTKLAREILAELRKRHDAEMLTSFINFNTKLKESTSFGQPITEYDATSIGCRDFVRLARELIAIGSDVPIPATILEQADALAADAERLLATSQTLLGPDRPMPPRRQVSAVTSETDAAFGEGSASVPTRVVATTASEGRRSGSNGRRTASDEEIQHKITQVYGVHATPEGVLFSTRIPGARTVRVAGDFNGWNSDVTALRPIDGGGTFQVRLPLTPGRYQYRYVVDGRWMNDPFNASVERNPFGEMNSVVVVD